jgi:transposase
MKAICRARPVIPAASAICVSVTGSSAWASMKATARRRVVERTRAWITRHRRTVRDYERLPAQHETYVYWSMVIVMTRRLARNAVGTSAPAQSDAA